MMTKEGSTKIINIMIPWAGVLVLGHGHISHIVEMHLMRHGRPGQTCLIDLSPSLSLFLSVLFSVYVFEKKSSEKQINQNIKKKKKRKCIISWEIIFSTPRCRSDNTNYIVMMTKIVDFMTPRAWVVVLGHVHINHKVKMHYFFKNHLLYSQR